MVASKHGDGVQRVGLAMVVANPCSTPEAGETSVSYPRPAIHPKWEWRMRGVDESRKERRERKEKYVQVQSVLGKYEQAKERMQSRGCGNEIKGRGKNDKMTGKVREGEKGRT